MPSEKSHRVAVRKSQQNQPIRTATRTAVRSAREAIDAGDPEPSVASVNQAIKALDQAATKGIIHKNNAARRKSRLMARLNGAKSAEA